MIQFADDILQYDKLYLIVYFVWKSFGQMDPGDFHWGKLIWNVRALPVVGFLSLNALAKGEFWQKFISQG